MSDLSTQALVAEAMLGRDAEQFLKTDLGRFMLERAMEEERDALEALASVWPWRRRRIQDLQAKLWRARSFQNWMGELISAGRQALEQMETPPE